MITGFCGETDAQFEDTATLMQTVKYDHAFMFAYSMREKTHAHRRMIGTHFLIYYKMMYHKISR
jgi:tRNA A37 methylthiotransferase MiaB